MSLVFYFISAYAFGTVLGLLIKRSNRQSKKIYDELKWEQAVLFYLWKDINVGFGRKVRVTGINRVHGGRDILFMETVENNKLNTYYSITIKPMTTREEAINILIDRINPEYLKVKDTPLYKAIYGTER